MAGALEPLLAKAEAKELSYLQFAHSLVEHKIDERNTKRISLNRRQANFPVAKYLEEFDYRHQTTITKRQVNQLLDFGFIDNRSNRVFIGPPGVGKTHLAIGIGQKALDAGYKVRFITALALSESLEIAELKGELKKKINSLTQFDLVIIDELGYLPMSKQGNYNLFQLISSLYEYRSIILTTNKSFNEWNDIFPNAACVVTLIDRLVHRSEILAIEGESYRLKEAKERTDKRKALKAKPPNQKARNKP